MIGDGPGSAPRGRPRGAAVASAVSGWGPSGSGVLGRSGRCCTFDRDPPSEDPRNHAETPRRSTPVKLSHVQTDLLCTWESADARSTIRENRGILRKTWNRPAGPPLSHVQSALPAGPGEGPRRPGVTARPIRAARARPGGAPPESGPAPGGSGCSSTRACAPSAPVREERR